MTNGISTRGMKNTVAKLERSNAAVRAQGGFNQPKQPPHNLSRAAQVLKVFGMRQYKSRVLKKQGAIAGHTAAASFAQLRLSASR